MTIDINATLSGWREKLVASIPVGGLISRNATVYKWKAPFRVWVLREAVAWRLVDLLTQSNCLYEQGHTLGARILLRSAFESLATLIYLNITIRQVVDGTLDFETFSELTSTLLLGARNNPEAPKSINVLTVLKKSDKEYPGLVGLYADLSESAHPSYEGLLRGYSRIDHDEYVTHFSSQWAERYGQYHANHMSTCIDIFHHEYDDVWPDLMTKLESWIVDNDRRLEATKG